MKLLKRIGIICVILVIVLGVGGWFYVSDYYKADEGALTEISSTEMIQVESMDDMLVFSPQRAKAGFIFYPGGKVEYESYAPLMRRLAEKDILCVLVKMPFHLAVLDMNAADGIQEKFPMIDKWYIGGHSLGGSMAASYVAKHTEAYEGLVLLAAYSTADLSKSNLQVISIIATEDKVLNREKYDKYASNLPNSTEEVVIEGGCHAYFGMYGAQEGDGKPTISNQEQIAMTADVIADSME